jgi:hypothetical protein
VTALYRGLDRAALDAQYNLRQAVPDAAAARRNSPTQVLRVDAADAPLILAVGGRETAEFHRQQAEFAAQWRTRGGRLAVVAQREEEHFSIMDRLGEPGSPLFAAIVDAMATSSPTGEQRRGVV